MPRTLTESPLKAKAFPLHRDTMGYFPDQPQMEAQIAQARDMESVSVPLKDVFYPEPGFRRYYRKHKAQFNDPFCLYYVLDLLVRQQRGTYVRPHYLLPRLMELAPMYSWNAGVVGRILSGVHAACASEYDMWSPDDAKKVPFARGRDAKSVYYAIDPLGGNEGLMWLLNCRKAIMHRVEGSMRAEATGDLRHTMGEPTKRDSVREWIPGDLYSEAWLAETRVREVEQYWAQADGQDFYRSAPLTKVDRSDPYA